MATTPNYSVNYDDKRFTEVEADKKAALNEVDVTYGNMISNSDKYYQSQIDATKDWADKQTQIQQDNTDFAIEQIEQQKQQAQKDYTKEQSGAYVDWQKQSNQYGANAEQMAAQGMAGTGYSESAQVSMYNTYQNRVATARESYNQAVLNYNNAIKDARLQNNAALAEIAYNALQKQLELSLEGFQYKNQLLIEQSNKKLEVDNTYYQRYQDVLNQINTENALAEEVRQYNQNYELEVKEYEEGVRQFNEELAEKQRQFNQNYELEVKQLNEEIRQFNEEIARLKAKDAQEYKVEIQKLQIQKTQVELQKQELEEEKRQFNESLAEEKRQYNTTQAAKSSSSSSKSSSGSSSSSKKSSSSSSSSNKNVLSRGTGLNAVNAVNKDADASGSSLTVDTKSVLNLGFGPISASRLNELVKSGVVEEYQSGNKLKYRKSASTNKQLQLYKTTLK